MMVERAFGVKASAGFASETGPRERNEDFAGVVFGVELPQPRRDVVAAIADGIGGAKGGRVAAETAVRGFLDGFCDLPETMEVRRASATVLNSLNRWIYSEGHRNAETARAWAAPSPRWCCAGGSPMCCMSATPALTGCAASASLASPPIMCARSAAPADRTFCPGHSVSRRKCGSITPHSRWRCMTAFSCAATACMAT